MSGEADDLRAAAAVLATRAGEHTDAGHDDAAASCSDLASRLTVLASRLPSLLALADAAEGWDEYHERNALVTHRPVSVELRHAVAAYRAQLSPSGPEERPQ